MKRRSFLKLSTSAVCLSLVPVTSSADEPSEITKALSIQNSKVGDWVVTALLDGSLEISADKFANLTETEATQFLKDAYKSDGPVPTGVNAYVLRKDDRLVLVDAGGAGAFPRLGALKASLAAINISANQVTDVLLTHLHPDHVGGMLQDGKAVFNNAKVHVHQADIDFWTDQSKKAAAPKSAQVFFDLATSVVSAYKSNLKPFTSDVELLPGIKTRHLPGHTPGHSGYVVGSGSDQLLIWGDIVHVAAFQFPKPTASIGFDVDSAAAVKTRLSLFEEVATNRTRVAGMHLSFPGIGYVEKEVNGYEFKPADWTFSL